MVERQLERLGVEPERVREAGLGVEVDEQDPLAELGERGAEGVDGGGLRHAALLVGDGHHPRHRRSIPPATGALAVARGTGLARRGYRRVTTYDYAE